MIDFRGSHFEKEIILWGVRWYVAYSISYCQLEEMLRERGVSVDHSTLNRWVIKYAPEVEKQFRRRQRAVGRSWRVDETSVKIKGQWASRYRGVDNMGQPVDLLRSERREMAVAKRFVPQALKMHGVPTKVTLEGYAASHRAVAEVQREGLCPVPLGVRTHRSLNNVLEQDQRAVKRVVRPMLGFTSFWSARCTIAGVEVMHAIRKEQLVTTSNERETPAEQFYSLAVKVNIPSDKV